MNYSKPEIEVLGDADRLIQGNKTQISEDGDDSRVQPAFELED
jgi:hypothetical protein